MPDLLPGTRELLVSLLDGLQADTKNLPEVRVGKPSRSGCRYWLYGGSKKPFEGRRQEAEFEELRSAGLLRKLRVDKSTGIYFAFTPAAFRERDAMLRVQASAGAGPNAAKRRPEVPPPELTAARSRLDVLEGLREEAKATLDGLLGVSQIRRTVENEPGSGIVFIPLHFWEWKQLAPPDRPLLGAARETGERWLGACRTTLASAGPEHLEHFDELSETVRRIYVRSSNAAGPLSEGIEANRRLVNKAVDDQFGLLEQLPGAHQAARLLLIPDTNALLKDPEIEHWQVGDGDCLFVIVSQVQAELDSMKSSERKVAAKAAGLIRRFKEYGRRGDTLAGVPLAGNRRFREVPIRPDMSLAPDWLDPEEPDDRILAAALGLASKHSNAPVVLVTRDRGLQNKARAAELPAVDVDDL
jgi:rRNA-processing protein FCF1